MLFLRSWLEEYIDLSNYSDNQLADIFSLKSGECESVLTIKDYFDSKVLVGKIQNVRQHPDAQKLQIFDVNLGQKTSIQIVSAAPNVREGLICPVAIDGAKLPYLSVNSKKMRGEMSMGMCCGMSELSLETQYSSGLWELNDLLSDEELGKSICVSLPKYFIEQTVFEIKYLQDRLSSCSNYLGLALEIAKCIQNPSLLKGVAKSINSGEDFFSDSISQIESSKRQIKLQDNTNTNNIYNIFSLNLDQEFTLPHQWQTRMFLTGKNLVGGLVDLSNYMLFDFGQPNHFFSATKIQSDSWKFMKLEGDEKFDGLGNFKKAVLPSDLVVLKDSDNQTLIVPGITGSQNTKIDKEEKNVLIEITNFPPELIARNAFRIDYRSDAAKFFASGVESSLQLLFLVKLIAVFGAQNISHSLLWNKGTIIDTISQWLCIHKILISNQPELEVNIEYIANRLDNIGTKYWKPIIIEKLKLIGNIYIEGENIKFQSNSYYSKIKDNDDLLFEISKLIGFENLSPQYLTFSADSKTLNQQDTITELKKLFTNFGVSEVITRPFLSKVNLLSTLTNSDQVALEALSSQRANEPFLRDSLFSSLMQIIAKNIKLGNKNPKIFEQSKIYVHSQSKPNLFATQIDGGNTWETLNFSSVIVAEDPSLLTSLINNIGFRLNLNPQITKIKFDSTVQNSNSTNKSKNNLGNTFCYQFSKLNTQLNTQDRTEPDNLILAQIDLVEISNKFKKLFDLPLNKKVWFLEFSFNLDKILFNTYNIYQDESELPIVTRSFSMQILKNTNWTQINDAINQQKSELFEIQIIPTERFPENHNFDNLNFDLIFTPNDRTLTNIEIENWCDQLFNNLSLKFDGLKKRE